MQVFEGVGMVWASIRAEDERVSFKNTRMMGDYVGPGNSSYTTIIYASDHGESLGARGLWGKMNMYQESAAIPLIIAPAPDAGRSLPKTCDTAVSLIDLSETIIDHFGASLAGERPGRSLYEIAGGAVRSRACCFQRISCNRCHLRRFHAAQGRLETHLLPRLRTRAFQPRRGSRRTGKPRQSSGLRRYSG